MVSTRDTRPYCRSDRWHVNGRISARIRDNDRDKHRLSAARISVICKFFSVGLRSVPVTCKQCPFVCADNFHLSFFQWIQKKMGKKRARMNYEQESNRRMTEMKNWKEEKKRNRFMRIAAEPSVRPKDTKKLRENLLKLFISFACWAWHRPIEIAMARCGDAIDDDDDGWWNTIQNMKLKWCCVGCWRRVRHSLVSQNPNAEQQRKQFK